MLPKIKIILNFLYTKSIFFLLSIFILQVNAETKIVAKDDDTLLKLSKQYGIPLKELMHKNNFNDANKNLGGEMIVIPLNHNNNTDEDDNEYLIYEVKEGDTIYKIARNYNVNARDIISINNLENSSYLKPNQIIYLPSRAIHKKALNKKDIKLTSKKVFYHQTTKVEEIIEIARIHNVEEEDIITLNELNDPIKVKPNIKLKIRENKSLQWLKYGSIIINWSDWRYLNGNYVTQAKNKKDKSFYLAVSCKRRALNNTLNNSYWTKWYFPKLDFEFKIINDFCDKDF